MFNIVFKISVIIVALSLVLGMVGFAWISVERAKFTDDNIRTYPSKPFCYIMQGAGWYGFTTGQRWACLNIIGPNPVIDGGTF